jgi:transcriptional regulator with GAF, ATPase, and Fis domain
MILFTGSGGSREGLAQLSEIRVFEMSVQEAAQEVVDLAPTSLDHCDGASMQLVDPSGLVARVSTDPRSSQLDTLQDELDTGPCVQCLRTGALQEFEPVTSDERWPEFAPTARRAGLIACLALPLLARGLLIGVLNLYAWPLGGFAGWDRPRCRIFAHYTAILLANAQAHARMQDRIRELQADVAASEDVVQRAYGALMARGIVTLDDAKTRLSELAAAERSSLEEAAQSVVDSINGT